VLQCDQQPVTAFLILEEQIFGVTTGQMATQTAAVFDGAQGRMFHRRGGDAQRVEHRHELLAVDGHCGFSNWKIVRA